jgi:hypothetical protein
MTLTIPPSLPLAPKFRKVYSYTSTAPLGFHGLSWGEIYLLYTLLDGVSKILFVLSTFFIRIGQCSVQKMPIKIDWFEFQEDRSSESHTLLTDTN